MTNLPNPYQQAAACPVQPPGARGCGQVWLHVQPEPAGPGLEALHGTPNTAATSGMGYILYRSLFLYDFPMLIPYLSVASRVRNCEILSHFQ